MWVEARRSKRETEATRGRHDLSERDRNEQRAVGTRRQATHVSRTAHRCADATFSLSCLRTLARLDSFRLFIPHTLTMGCAKSKPSPVEPQLVEPKREEQSAPVVQRYYTASMVALHPSVEKSPLRQLWTIISGNVYSIGSFLSDHPGGEDVLIQYAGGKDATLYFMEEGNDERPFAHKHSKGATAQLERFKIGTLVAEGDPRAGKCEEEVATAADAPVAAAQA